MLVVVTQTIPLPGGYSQLLKSTKRKLSIHKTFPVLMDFFPLKIILIHGQTLGYAARVSQFHMSQPVPDSTTAVAFGLRDGRGGGGGGQKWKFESGELADVGPGGRI